MDGGRRDAETSGLHWWSSLKINLNSLKGLLTISNRLSLLLVHVIGVPTFFHTLRGMIPKDYVSDRIVYRSRDLAYVLASPFYPQDLVLLDR